MPECWLLRGNDVEGRRQYRLCSAGPHNGSILDSVTMHPNDCTTTGVHIGGHVVVRQPVCQKPAEAPVTRSLLLRQAPPGDVLWVYQAVQGLVGQIASDLQRFAVGARRLQNVRPGRLPHKAGAVCGSQDVPENVTDQAAPATSLRKFLAQAIIPPVPVTPGCVRKLLDLRRRDLARCEVVEKPQGQMCGHRREPLAYGRTRGGRVRR